MSSRAARPSDRVWPVLMALLVLLALFGSHLSPYDVSAPDYRLRLALPTLQHPLGTDHLGRDLAARILTGARASLGLSLAVATLATLLGLAIGVAGALGGRRADGVLTAVAEIVQTLPAFVVAITLAAAFGSSPLGLVLTLVTLSWTTHARLVRALVRAIGQREHVVAARLYGLSSRDLLRRHYLPLLTPALLVTWSENWSRAILAISGLGFLGLGVPPPQPEWGAMLADGRSYMGSAPVVMIGPGLAVVLSVLTINLFGDWLRDRFALDEARAA